MTNPAASSGNDWVTIFMGEPWRVALLEGELESAGILTLVPDRMIKTIDPFITGANPFALRLQVPNFQCAAALEVIGVEPQNQEVPAAQDSDVAWLARKSAEGRRIRRAALFLITAPLVPWLAVRYFSGLRGRAQMPPGHLFTVLATGYSLGVIFALGLLLSDYLGFYRID